MTFQFNMLVTYTYRSDDPTPSEGNEGLDISPSKGSKQPLAETKAFTFYTVVDLGAVIPRQEPKDDTEF